MNRTGEPRHQRSLDGPLPPSSAGEGNGEGEIALLCQHFYPEMISTGMHMTELATGLTRKGYRIRVYCAPPAYQDETQSGPVPAQMEHQGIRIIRVPALGVHRGSYLQRGLFALSYLLGTAWCVYRDRKQLVGVIATTNPPFIGLAACILKALTGKPFVTIVYDVYPDLAVRLGVLRPRSLLAHLWGAITRLILNCSARIVVIGRDMVQVVAQKLNRLDPMRITLIPNWSDADQVHPVPREDNEFIRQHGLQDVYIVQYSGRMGRTHNIEPLLEAAHLLRDEPVVFQLIGDGAKKNSLQRAVAQMGLTNVQFLPYQPLEKLADVLSAPHLAVVCLDRLYTGLSVPSKTYGIMAGGCPILAFLDPQSEIGQTIQETDCGIILPDPDGQQIAAIIHQLMAHPERFEQMGKNGRRVFLGNFTLSLAVERYDRLLREIYAGIIN